MNAFTTKEYTAYYTRLPAARCRLGLELLGDVVTAPALRDDDVESERQVILEELAMDEDTPDDKVAHAALRVAVPRPSARARDRRRRRDGRAAIDRRRRPPVLRRAGTGRPTIVVAAAGALDHDAVVAEVRASLRRRRRRTAPCGAPPDGGVVGRSPCAGGRSSRPTSRSATAASPAATRPRPALDVVNHVPRRRDVEPAVRRDPRAARPRLRRVLAPSVYCDAGALTIYAGTAPAHVDAVLDLIEVELEKLVDGGLTDDELDVAKGSSTGSYLLGLEDPGSRMARLGGLLVTTGRGPPGGRAAGPAGRPSTTRPCGG